jgi:uncharacterized protein YegP (UPF0339 family)
VVHARWADGPLWLCRRGAVGEALLPSGQREIVDGPRPRGVLTDAPPDKVGSFRIDGQVARVKLGDLRIIASNGQVLATSETYTTKASAVSINSVKANAATASLEDLT